MMSITIRIDDEPFEMLLAEVAMVKLLDLAGLDSSEHYIQRIKGNQAETPYIRLHDRVALEAGDCFVTVYTGACTAQ